MYRNLFSGKVVEFGGGIEIENGFPTIGLWKSVWSWIVCLLEIWGCSDATKISLLRRDHPGITYAQIWACDSLTHSVRFLCWKIIDKVNPNLQPTLLRSVAFCLWAYNQTQTCRVRAIFTFTFYFAQKRWDG